MPTRPSSPDPRSASSGDQANPFAGLGAGLGAGMDFFQDWLKAAGSALPHMPGAPASASSAMPAWSMPTLDPAELEKRIQDLKTVQFWLEQNARMIAMSIQGLEVQRMTLSTLKGMNVSMDALRDSLKAKADTASQAFGAAATAAAPPAAAPRPTATPSGWPHRASPTPDPEEVAGSDDGPAPAATQAASTGTPTADSPDLINPVRWWETLTQQFTHLASQAAQSVGDSVGGSLDMLKQAQAGAANAASINPTAAGKSTAKSAAKPAGKPGAKTGAAAKKATATRKTSKASPAGKRAPAKPSRP